MKLFNIFLFFCLLFCFSCKNDKKDNQPEISIKTEKDSTSAKNVANNQQNAIDLKPVTSDVPHFNNKEADAFVNKTKVYFEQMAEANKANNAEKIEELQLQAIDIDAEMQKVKSKLNTEQQKQLTDWYMKLVKAASE